MLLGQLTFSVSANLPRSFARAARSVAIGIALVASAASASDDPFEVAFALDWSHMPQNVQHLRALAQAEARDESWAPAMERKLSKLSESFSGATGSFDVRCRTTICEAMVGLSGTDGQIFTASNGLLRAVPKLADANGLKPMSASTFPDDGPYDFVMAIWFTRVATRAGVSPNASAPARPAAGSVDVDVELTVDDKGKPNRCRITRSSGNPQWDSVVCDTFLAQGRFKPTTDKTGRPISSTVRMTVSVPSTGQTAM